MSPTPPVPLAHPRPVELLRKEMASLGPESVLVDKSPLRVVTFRSHQAPNVMAEIGRQRERTFRAVGEGSGQPADLDSWDASYAQLVLWNDETGQVLGGYRLAEVAGIAGPSGNGGLYTQSCFRYGGALLRRLSHAIELGRSFVVPEVQRSFHPLLLLWMGIGTWFDRHPHLHAIVGTLSMSADYSVASRADVARFLLSTEHRSELAPLVRPVHRFVFEGPGAPLPTYRDVEAAVTRRDGRKPPVLVKHYLQLGMKGLCAGVDPDFGSCLDVLCVADLRNAPASMLRRTMGRPAHERFLQRHGTLEEVT
ncbi:MAG: GNAT family N-acetyltransferase [Myxococcales bacterium]|nr:GNAT family N-acetyltransferase [Myxococcales bacterium]